MNLKKSLEPVINDDSLILILGSMPGEESLRSGQYYAYPRNHFWRIIAALTGNDVPRNYEQRIRMIRTNRIALWDVIASCRREGSLDTNIHDESYNNVPYLLEQYSGIGAVFFNGQKAANSFKQQFGFRLLEKKGIYYKVLPSSSPANTTGFDLKLEMWNIIKKFLMT